MKKIVSLLTVAALTGALMPAAMAAEGLENLALNKTVTAGSQYSQTSYLPQSATDGVIDGAGANRWAASDSGVYKYTVAGNPAKTDNNQWLTVDLGEEMNVNRVILYFQWLTNGQMTRISDFKIQYSTDNNTFADVVTAEGRTTFIAPTAALASDPDAALADIKFNTVCARYIRFLPVYAAAKNTAKNGVSIQELEVYYDPAVISKPNPDLSGLENIALTAEAAASDEYSAAYSAAKTVDGDTNSRWASKEEKPVDNTQKYLELKFSDNQKFNMLAIHHFTGDNHQPRIAAFKLEYSDDNTSWKNVCKDGEDTVFYCDGYDNSDTQVITFDTVNAKYLRLTPTENLLCGSTGGNIYGISIWELGVYHNPSLDPEPIPAEKSFAASEVAGASQTDIDGTKIQGWTAEYETAPDKTTSELGMKFQSTEKANALYVPVIKTNITGGATYRYGVLMSGISQEASVTAEGYAYEK